MDIAKLNEVWDEQKRFLRDGLIDGSIWGKSTGLLMSSVGQERPEFVALFSQLIDEIDYTLLGSGFSGLNRFMIMNMESTGSVMLVIKHDDEILQAMMLDPKKTNLGILFNVAIPKALAKVQEAKA